VDPAERLPGRGLWLTPRRDIVERAVAKGLFAKAAGRRVIVPADLAAEVERLLRQRCLALLGLARRAGQLRTGFEKVREDLKAGRAGLLLAARDGAPDGRQKLAALAGGRPEVALFDSVELSAALGREEVVHAMVPHGRSKTVAVEVKRKRTYAPGAGGKMTEVAEKELALAAELSADDRAHLSNLTAGERATRLKALEEARRDDEIRRQQEAEEAQR